MPIALRCHRCEKAMQVADSAAGKKARCPGCQALLDIPEGVHHRPAAASSGVTAVGSISSESKPSSVPIQVICSTCGKELLAPALAAGKAVRCPGCRAAVKVPATVPSTAGAAGRAASAQGPASRPAARMVPVSTRAATAAPTDAVPSAENAMWDALADAQRSSPAGGAWSGAAGNSYTQMGYGDSGFSYAKKANRTPFYIINGVFISLWGLLLVGGSVLRLVLVIIALSNLPPNVTVDYARLSGLIVGLIFALILGAIQLLGGVLMAMRSNLGLARTTSIVAAIPCFGGLVFPFGIWAAILVFSPKAKSDFGE